jgi:capsular polysaccharide transport system ATP-binding protein
VLKGVNIRVEKGQSLGILGRNGAGKSTLMRILAGVEAPTAGRVRRTMNVSWPIGMAAGFSGQLTGADNVRFIARIYDKPIDSTLARVEGFAELGPYMRMPLATYSSGMRARLGFAVSLAIDFDCYLVDEGLAVGDTRFAERYRQAVAERLKRSSVIMVTHSPALVRAFCRTAAVLDGGILTLHEDLDEALATYNAL